MTDTTPIETVLGDLPVDWSILVRDVTLDQTILEHASDRILKTASVGKLFILAELAARIDKRDIDPALRLAKSSTPEVRDSGLWWQMAQADLAIDDLATLIGAVSDNWATNVLLRHLGLEAVQERARLCGYSRTQLHDYVRDDRTDAHPATLSSGCASELCDFMARLTDGANQMPGADDIRRWLYTSVDHSMVASAFALDPLINGRDHPDCSILNKTGTDDGVRTDVGLLQANGHAYAYAVIANWRSYEASPADILGVMRFIGRVILLRTRRGGQSC